jgi:hypothetical protein
MLYCSGKDELGSILTGHTLLETAEPAKEESFAAIAAVVL